MSKFKKIVNKIIEGLDVFVEKILLLKVSLSVLASSFLGIIILRVFEEKFLASSESIMAGTINGFLYNFFFFVVLYLLIWTLLSLALKTKLTQLVGLILWSFWLVLLPPVIDMIKTGGSVFWSFYTLDTMAGLWQEFITFFGNLPPGIVYFGTKIVFILTIGLVFLLVWIKTKRLIRAFSSAFLAYIIMFLLGSLPSWLTMIYYFFAGDKKISAVNSIDIIQFFGSPQPIFGLNSDNIKYAFTDNLNTVYFFILVIILGGMFFSASRPKFWAVIKNARIPQIIYHSGLLLMGVALGVFIYPQNWHLNIFSILSFLVILAGVWLAWEASVVVNDLNDFEIDNITNQDRPLQKNIFTKTEYADLGIILFSLSILAGLLVGVKFAILFFVYQLLAWFYSAPPFRLKRFPIIATFFSALASVTVLMIGYSLFSGEDNMKLFPWRIIILLLINLTISLPIKDFKDIAGDRADNVWTIPVLFGEELGRTIIASNIFISFMLSVFLLNEFKLFWLALLWGGAAFLAVTNKKIKPRRLFWWVLGCVFVYVIILGQALFMK